MDHMLRFYHAQTRDPRAENMESYVRWQALGELLRYSTTLSSRQSELAILVTGRACRSPFEWYAHRPEAEKAGLPAAVIDAIFTGATPTTMSAEDSAVYHYTLELNRINSISTAPTPMRWHA
jgi:4-carboxymuconolactone decarboxylase